MAEFSVDEIMENAKAAGFPLDSGTVTFTLLCMSSLQPPTATESVSKAKDTRLPVTVLSGFLGAGKTTLLQRILSSPNHGLRVAVIVNDMAAVNVDANAVVKIAPKLVSMQNGCICCTLREDLLEQVSELARAEEWDYLVIESTGISEPLPVAQTFVMDVNDNDHGEEEEEEEEEEQEDGLVIHRGVTCDGSGECPLRGKRYHKIGEDFDLNETEFAKLSSEEQRAFEVIESPGDTPVPIHAETAKALTEAAAAKSAQLRTLARLDTMVTVVDCVTFFDRLSTLEMVKDQPDALTLSEGEEERTLSDLMVDQVEFADVILLNKVDKANAQQLCAVEALIKKLNPGAKIYRTSHSDVSLNKILNTHLFDMDKAQLSAGWIAELQKPTHTPESEEYGVSSLIYRAARPFHPVRLRQLIQGIGSALSVDSKPTKGGKEQAPLAGVMRSKGQIWLANSYSTAFTWHSAGRIFSLDPEGAFIARVIETELGVETVGDAFAPAKGDAQFEQIVQEAERVFGDDDHTLGEIDRLKEAGHWNERYGDRQQEVVLIGVHLDKPKIRAALDTALLTPAEYEAGPQSWKEFEDPFFKGHAVERFWDLPEDGEVHDHDEGEGSDVAGHG